VDKAGNALALPATSQMIGFDPTDQSEGFPLEIYRFLLKGIRDADRIQGNLLLKRWLDGPQKEWEKWIEKAEDIKKIWRISETPDELLCHLLLTVGWTDDLKVITDQLDFVQKRRLIDSSIRLWKRRGSAGSYLEILNVLVGIDGWIWDWFDTRWILDEGYISEQRDGTDIFLTDDAGARTVNLRLVDPDQELERSLVEEAVKLWRPSGERVLISFVDVLDRFDVDEDIIGWDITTGLPNPEDAVSGGTLNLTDTAVVESATVNIDAASLWSNILFYTKLTGAAVGVDWFGVDFHGGDYSVRLRTDTQTLELHDTGGLLATVALFADHGIPVVNGQDLGLRVHVEYDESATSTRIRLYVDNVEVLDLTNVLAGGVGTITLSHTTGSEMTVDWFEVVKLPAENIFVDINS